MLALWFLHLWFALAAAPVGAAVILVHLLRPGRHKPVRWAAMQFLLAAVAESRRRLRLERWLLLLLRTSLLMLLALMLARPVQRGLAALLGERDGSALLVIVDNGLAMQAPSSLLPHTLMEQAIEAASSMVHSWPGQVFVLPALGEPASQWLSRADWAESTLNRTPATAGRAGWSALLATARKVLPESGVAAGRRTVLLLTTLTRGNWPDTAELAQPLAELSSAAGCVILVDVPPADRRNVAVTDLVVESAFAGHDLPARAVATIANHANDSAKGFRVLWSVDGREIRQDDLDEVPAGSTRHLLADIPAFGAGRHNVQVQIAGPGDALKADDQRWSSVSLPKMLRVVVVEADLAGPAASRASLFVIAALQSAAQQSSVPIRVEPVAPGGLSSALIEPADVVVLCDVGALTSADGQRLAEQVRAGCGLLAWSGPRSAAIRYANEAQQLLPASSQTPDTAADGQGWPVQLAEPIRPAFLDLTSVSTAGDSALGSVHSLLKVMPAADTQVLAHTASGAPVALLRRIGQARTVLVATSPDLAWTNMPGRPSFPAFVLGLLREVLPPRDPQLQVTCGQPIRLPVSDAAGQFGQWIKPDGTAEPARISLDAGRLEAVLSLAAMPGPYQLEATAAGQTVFASADPQAGDLAPLPQVALRPLLQAGLTVAGPKDLATSLAAGAADEWTGPLAYVLLALLLGELLLTGWFTRARQA